MKIRTIVLITFFAIVGYIGGIIGFTAWLMTGGSKISDSDFQALVKKGSVSSIQAELRDYIVESVPRDLKYGYKTAKEAFKTAESDKLIIADKENKPSNYDDYKTKFCNYVLDRIKTPKDNTAPNFEEAKKLPGNPPPMVFLHTTKYWAYISLILDCEGFDKESLLTAFGGYYFSRDWEKNYQSGGSTNRKVVAVSMRNVFSQEILRWASKPRNVPADINKMLAKDILELVKNEYSFVRCLEFDREYAKHFFKIFSKKGNILAFLASFGTGFKNSLDFWYGVENKTFIGKPYYQCREELRRFNSEYSHKVDEAFDYRDKSKRLIKLTLLPVSTVREMVLSFCTPNYVKVKESIELSKAKMEMASIALVYNGFYTAKGRTADSMEELEEWFGEKLPIDRYTGKAYKLHENEGYVVYNAGIDGVKSFSNSKYSYSDDFYFIFDKE